jgi:hypothetical protein
LIQIVDEHVSVVDALGLLHFEAETVQIRVDYVLLSHRAKTLKKF